MWALVEMKQSDPSVLSSNPTDDFDKQQFYLAEHNVSISIATFLYNNIFFNNWKYINRESDSFSLSHSWSGC